jgi:uncharacterized membrane protein YeaQ/YmgE (transglycosylase-associated protein family)
MVWIWTIIVGLVVGAVARFLLPGKDPIGFVGTLVIGVLGAIIGTWLWNLLLPNNDNQGVAVIAALVVAVILLLIYRAVVHRRGTGTARSTR